jgi:hypothetical protein
VSDAAVIVTSPLPVAAGLGVEDAAVAVVADSLARRMASAAGADVTVHLPVLAGDRSAVLALERAGRPVADLVPFLEARAALADGQLAALGVAARVAGATLDPRLQDAATVAFVRLYDQGLVDEVDMVAAVCPSCATVVDGADAEPGTVEADVLDVVVRGDTGELVVPVVAPELLAGATAVAVPLEHPAAGGTATLPFVGRGVPIVAETGRVEPAFVVPAHSREGHELALLHGLDAPVVLGHDAVVRGDGPLAGLTRYAARQAARELIEAEGAVVGVAPGEEQVERCRHCGSATVPVLDRHWALRGGRLEVAAADAVRDGLVGFVPADARDAFLAIALPDRPWCLDRTVPGGLPLPVSTCVDCGRVSVDATPSTSCHACLGELRPSDRTLDARFVAALWPLVVAGDAGGAPPVLAVVPPAATATWLLPALALARHFTGELPIGAVVVHPPAPWPDGAAFEMAGAAGRLTLLAGDSDADVQAALDELERPRGDDREVADAVEAAASELDDGGAGPAQATALLLAALARGVRAADADRVRRAAAPFLGGD